MTAIRNMTNCVIKVYYVTESNYDKVTLMIKGSYILSNASGNSNGLTQVWSGNLSIGDTISMSYSKDGSVDADGENVYFVFSCDPYVTTTTTTTTENVIIGYETKDLARKIEKIYSEIDNSLLAYNIKYGYVGINNLSRLFYGDKSGFEYSGDYEDLGTSTINNVNYKIYRLETSGTLTLLGFSDNAVKYWGCGGGGGGYNGRFYNGEDYNQTDTYMVYGGGGGSGYINAGNINSGEYTIIIGAGGASETLGSSTSLGSITISGATSGNGTVYKGSIGASSGGCAKYWELDRSEISTSTVFSDSYMESGIGTPFSNVSPLEDKYPFGITSLQCHCAGGSGGSVPKALGGRGGGAEGEPTQYTLTSTLLQVPHTSGGSVGGGAGGKGGYDRGYSSTESGGQNATFWGSGGGGGGGPLIASGIGGAGYQGCVYIAIPA